jgi:hypothetical protein
LGIKSHSQQYFHYTFLVSFIGGENWNTQKHYPDSEPTSLFSFSLMLRAYSGEATDTNFIVFGKLV